MKKLNVITLLLLLALPVYAQPPVFTEQDLERYKSNDQQQPSSPNQARDERIEGTRQRIEKTLDTMQNQKDKTSQDYYCRWGTYHRDQVDRYKERVEFARKELARADQGLTSSSPRAYVQNIDIDLAKSRLRGAEENLKGSERDLLNFENEAHRKNIPAGWLRCQF